ncbi:HlyD family type I secretion periplasmic adaptor subunit [Falsiroseomonas stagni]|uniref:Membrane fusion protein (MFP) family protein n=1 Tax=Falsiroseomonas stagni DSM 19981 TaxID=1123062 RepID=A0A1I4BTS6_9PROT|nr:HlyD family type I secretion periplasmic adaptor subunit [Falsiroseomonas stagni]SFK72075.1 HlyD family secretion protein [Falsiroseomonas stagni DSM 19981]
MSTARLTGPKSIPLSFAEADAAARMPSVRRIGLAALLLLVVGFGGLLFWAAITPIERAVVSRGSLVAEGRRKSIVLSEPGILQQLLVREGERVQAGTVLLRLDPTTAEAAAAQARAQARALAVRVERLRAEQQDERRFVAPREILRAAERDPGLANIVASEQRLFTARWQAYDSNMAVYERRVAVQREQLQATAAQRASVASRIGSIRTDLAGQRPLAQQGFALMSRVRELERTEAELLGSAGALAAQEAQYRQAIAQAEAEMATFRLTRAQDIARELQDNQQLLLDAEQRVLAAENVRSRRDLVAPEAGIVTDIRFVTPGSSISDGVPVLDLLPLDDRLVIEAKVLPADVEQLHIGSRVNVRLSAFRQRTTPLLAGHLTYVSADQQTDAQGNQFFLARAQIDAGELSAIPGLQLQAGMPVELFVLGETRSALAYIISPIRDSLRRSLRD